MVEVTLPLLRQLASPTAVAFEVFVLHWLATGEPLRMAWELGENDGLPTLPSPESTIYRAIREVEQAHGVTVKYADVPGTVFAESGAPCRLRCFYIEPTPGNLAKCYAALLSLGFRCPSDTATSPSKTPITGHSGGAHA